MGRVGGASRTLAFGALPLGALAGGLVGHELGLRAVWIVGGSVHLAATAIATPIVRRSTPETLLGPGQEGGADPATTGAPPGGSAEPVTR